MVTASTPGAVGCSMDSESPTEVSQRDAAAEDESEECIVSPKQLLKVRSYGKVLLKVVS